MSFDSDFLELMVDEVQLQPSTGHDVHGAATHGAATTWRCRVVYKDRIYRTITGDTVASFASVIFAGSPAVGTSDKITLPDGTSPPILLAKRFSDENGAHHTEVALGAR